MPSLPSTTARRRAVFAAIAASIGLGGFVAAPAHAAFYEGVTLDWRGNAEMQGTPFFGGSNYFSAGQSDGSEATYAAAAGTAQILQVTAEGAETPATYATRAAHTSTTADQVARLVDGLADVGENGAGTVTWDGTFSVNFYGGLAPFWIEDPQLVVNADGTGELVADLGGYASSMLDPTTKTPVPPVADATIATFEAVDLAPGGEITVTPHYAGVEVTIPAGQTQQNRTAEGWGAWPQEMVDFQLATGLSSYWYSSGSSLDRVKPPVPFAVDLTDAVEVDEPTEPPTDPGTTPPVGGGGGGGTTTPPAPEPVTPAPSESPAPAPTTPAPTAPAAPATPVAASTPVETVSGTPTVPGNGRVTVAELSCPAGAACSVTVPKRVSVVIGGKRYSVQVLAPKRVTGGQTAAVRIVLPKAAREALAGRRATVRVPVALGQGGERTSRTVKVSVKGKARR